MPKLLDYVAKKQSWKGRHLRMFRPVHHPRILDSDLDYYSLNSLPVFGRGNLFLAHKHMTHTLMVADMRMPIKVPNVADQTILMLLDVTSPFPCLEV